MSEKHGNDEEVFGALADDVASLQEFVEQQGRRDATQQKAFDQLYEELRQYKEDFIYQAEKPLLLDLLLFYDSLNWFQDSLSKNEMSEDVLSDSFQYLIDEFLELLYRRVRLLLATSDASRKTTGDPLETRWRRWRLETGDSRRRCWRLETRDWILENNSETGSEGGKLG